MGYIALAVLGSICGLLLGKQLETLVPVYPPLTFTEGIVRAYDPEHKTITVQSTNTYSGAASGPTLLVHYDSSSWYRLTYLSTDGVITGVRINASAPGEGGPGSAVGVSWYQKNAQEINAKEIAYEVSDAL
jgi:hypothetical protein